MLQRLINLLRHEGMRHDPVGGVGRMAAWAGWVARGHAPPFHLTPGGALLQMPANLSHTSVAAFVLRDHIEPELGWLDRILGPSGVFLDVGANVGLFALKAAHLVGAQGRVVAIEPGTAASAALEANFALNHYAHVTIIRRAVSDHVGTAVLHHVELGGDPQAFSLLDDGRAPTGETVELTTLDTLVDELGLSHVDVVKLDVEGVEAEAVAGGHQLFTHQRPIVIFEINHSIAVAQGRHLGAFQALAAHGYVMHSLHRQRLTPVELQPEGAANLVAIHPQGVQIQGVQIKTGY